MSKTYQKFRCANCGHEFISGANKPRCSKCYSTRLNKIEKFSLEKQIKPKQEVKPMPQAIKETIKPKEEEKPKPKKEEEEQDDIDEMLGF